ncbi:MAG: glycosyltransferase [Thermoanaerobaculia bacterium]|nr:glycosyltransferase [Thermoanaerobaculia bacterium]
MRVLYESLFFDATQPHAVRGPGHVMYRALERASDVELRCLGPPTPRPWLAERALRRIYRRATGRRYLRFLLSQAARASSILNREVEAWRPDVVLTMFPAALWRYRGKAPAIYRVDTTYQALAREYPEHGYSRLMASAAARFQARACRRSRLLLTHSDWSRNCLRREYGIRDDLIRVFPNTGGLPPTILGEMSRGAEIRRESLLPLNLLFVGLDAHRKGLDTTLETVRRLRSQGLDCRLQICGLQADAAGSEIEDGVTYLGLYDKSNPDELENYAELYRRAHLLIHPARFDPSPMVVAEAAAFGVPTVTHDVCGMTSLVVDGQTGVVLPAGSRGSEFAEAIHKLTEDTDRYHALRRGARERYDQHLSWDRFGAHLMKALEDVSEHSPRSATAASNVSDPEDRRSDRVQAATQAQEDKYFLPYHWFPEKRLPKYTRLEKQRIVFAMIQEAAREPIRRYLDLGCGDGRWTSDVHRFLRRDSVARDVESCGIDISERAIGFARLISPHIEFLDFGGGELPFADDSFDLATSIEVIEHIDSEHEALHLTEACRVLRPGGVLVLTTPSELLPMPPQHLRHYTVDGLSDLIRSCGFEVIAVRGQSSPWASRFKKLRKTMNRAPFIWKPWLPLMRERPPERATNLLIAARKPG